LDEQFLFFRGGEKLAIEFDAGTVARRVADVVVLDRERKLLFASTVDIWAPAAPGQ
jgi:hypothetical protein